MRKALLIIDPQYDFVSEVGSLSIKGASEPLNNIIRLMETHGNDYDAVYITQDCHPSNHVSYKCYWHLDDDIENKGFVTVNDILDFKAKWTYDMTAGNFSLKRIVGNMLSGKARQFVLSMNTATFISLYENERLKETILNGTGADGSIFDAAIWVWPKHCENFSEGMAVDTNILNAAFYTRGRLVQIMKGTSQFKEELSAFSDWEILTDNGKDFFKGPKNMYELYDLLTEYEQIDLCGFAKDYCVASTFKDLAEAAKAVGSQVKCRLLDKCCACINPNNESLKVYEQYSDFLVD